MNRSGKTRAAQGVKKKFNEYKYFHQNEITTHILASFMEMHNMKSIDGRYIYRVSKKPTGHCLISCNIKAIKAITMK